MCIQFAPLQVCHNEKPQKRHKVWKKRTRIYPLKQPFLDMKMKVAGCIAQKSTPQNVQNAQNREKRDKNRKLERKLLINKS